MKKRAPKKLERGPAVTSAYYYLNLELDRTNGKKLVRVRVAPSTELVAEFYGSHFNKASLRALGRVLDACHECGQRHFASTVRNIFGVS